MTNLTRGRRNNNPFNIRRSYSRWLGLGVPFGLCRDKEFCQFKEMEYGLRAGMLLISNYIRHHKQRSINGIIRRFAPSSENNTDAYISFVVSSISNYLGDLSLIQVNNWLVLPGDKVFFALCRAICIYESSYFVSVQELKNIWIRYELGTVRD